MGLFLGKTDKSDSMRRPFSNQTGIRARDQVREDLVAKIYRALAENA